MKVSLEHQLLSSERESEAGRHASGQIAVWLVAIAVEITSEAATMPNTAGLEEVKSETAPPVGRRSR